MASTQLPSPVERSASHLRALLVLLALSILINYIDRADFSIIAPLLKDELHISAGKLGFLLSAFFWTYAAATLLSGWLIDRFEVSSVLAAGFFLWSGTTAATGLVHGFAGLFAVRLILGIGAAVALPAYSKIIARHVSVQHRGTANACVAAGVFLGPAAASAGGMLFARFGWRTCFIVLGLASLAWLLPWRRIGPRGPGCVPSNSGPAPGTGRILRQRSAWGTFAGLFCGQYYFYFLITWLPYYLLRRRGFSTETMSVTLGGAFLGMAISALLAGRLSDMGIQRGLSPTLVRKAVAGGGMGLASLVALAPLPGTPAVSTAALVLACICFGASYSNTWAITQTLAGPHAVARWSGLKNFIGNLSGIVAPVITGFLVGRDGGFTSAFLVVGAFTLAGGAAWIFLVGRVHPVEW